MISEAPSCYENAIWLEDTRKRKRCSRCTKNKRCTLCIKNIDSEVNIIKFENEIELNKVLKKTQLIPIPSFNDVLFLSNIKNTNYEIFTPSRIQRLQKKVQGFLCFFKYHQIDFLY